MNFEKKINEIEDKIEKINKNMKEAENRKKIKSNSLDIGIISIIDNRLKIELLLNQDDFSKEHLEKLKNIANDLQDLLLEIYCKGE
jgi:predicted transcriptional regulator